LAILIYGIEQRQGFIAIIGEVGVGKTTILRAFLEHVDTPHDRIISIYNPNLTFNALLDHVLDELGQKPCSSDSASMIRQLQDLLIAQHGKQGTIVLLIDEAQNMPIETLENLRMLSNIETNTDKLLQIVLIGQPELDAVLSENVLRQLRQRITLRALIRPLTTEESFAYIQHRLAKSGVTLEEIFLNQAVKLIIREADGIPRRLNILCDNALLTGYGYRQKPISVKTVKEVVADIDGRHPKEAKNRWVPLAIAALLVLVTVPWVLLNQDMFTLISSKENNQSRLQESVQPQFNTQAFDGDEPVFPSTLVAAKKEQMSSSLDPAASMGVQTLPVELSSSPTINQAFLKTQSGSQHVEVNQQEPKGKAEIARNGSKVSPARHSVRNTALLASAQDVKQASTSLDDQSKSRIVGNREQKPWVDIYTNTSSQNLEHMGETRGTDRPHHTSALPLQTYTIKKGDTLDRLVRARYGRANPKRIQQVLKQNPHIKGPKQLYPGQQITFPLE